jgi:hypothetical protein
METSTLEWLARIGWLTFSWALAGLMLVNGAAIAAWLWRKDRLMVQRWAAPWLAANLLLVAIGVGVPALTSAGRLAILATTNSAPVSAFRAVTAATRPAD